MSPVTHARASLREPLIVFAATTLLAAGLARWALPCRWSAITCRC